MATSILVHATTSWSEDDNWLAALQSLVLLFVYFAELAAEGSALLLPIT